MRLDLVRSSYRIVRCLYRTIHVSITGRVPFSCEEVVYGA